LTIAEKLTIASGQKSDKLLITVTVASGLNLRVDPDANSGKIKAIQAGDIMFWDGQVIADSKGRIWYHVHVPGQDGWVAWRPANGEHYVDIWQPENLSRYRPDCADHGSCTMDYSNGKTEQWINYEAYINSPAQYLNIRKILKAANRDIDPANYPEIHENLCGVLASAYIAGISVEQAVLLYLDTVIKTNAPYGPKPMQEFFHRLGYITTYDTGFRGKVESVVPNGNTETSVTITYNDGHSEEMDGIIIGVNIDTGQNGELTNQQQTRGSTVAGHWVVLLEYVNSGTIQRAEIYNPFINDDKTYDEDLWRMFQAAWWGDGLQAQK
jgi:hypothetical protein